MRIVFKILTLGCLLYSLFALVVPIIIMFAKGNTSSWQGYIYEGLESVPETFWDELLGFGECPIWLTVLY